MKTSPKKQKLFWLDSVSIKRIERIKKKANSQSEAVSRAVAFASNSASFDPAKELKHYK